MSEKFGLSHRQVVRDVNEGNVVPPATKAVTSRSGVSAGKADTVIQQDDGKTNLVNTLVRAAGQVGNAVSREQDRRAAIEGYNMAGTEEGRKAVAGMEDSLSTMIFGPNPKLRAAQERIAMDQTNDLKTKLDLDSADFGHKMTAEEWQAHTDATLKDTLDKYKDDDIKDQITMRYGQNLTAVQRDWTKANHVFLQNEERESVMDRSGKSAELAQADLDSQDPHRIADAEQRYGEAFAKPEGMTDEAFDSAMVTVVSNELANGRGGMYEYGESRGAIDSLDFEQQEQLKTMKGIFDAEQDEQYIVGMQQLEYLAKSDGDIDQVTTLAKALQKQNPQLFANGIAPFVEMAFDRQVELQSEAQLRRENEHRALTGDPALSRQPEKLKQQAMEDMLLTMAENGVRAELKADYQRRGEHMPKDIEITPQAMNRYSLDNTASWARLWAINKIPTDHVKQLGNMVIQNIGRVDTTESDATNLQNDLNSLMVLRGESPEFFAKHFDAADTARIVKYHRQMNEDGQNPFEVVQRLREAEDRKDRGLEYPALEAGVASDNVETIVDDFVDEKGEKWLGFWDKEPENQHDISQHAKRYFEEEYARTGDEELSRDYALQRLNKGSTVIGNKFILGGAQLDKQAFGGDYDRFLEGINDTQSEREKLILQYGLDEDFDLRSDSNRFLPNPDGSGVTIWIEAENAFGGRVEKPVVINSPKRKEHILPTTGEQYWESIRSTLFESRSGGSFSSQPGMSGE